MIYAARALLGGLLLVVLFAGVVSARQWTDRNGRTVEAQYARLDGDTVILQQGLKVLRVPFDSLSDDDQEWIRKKNGGKFPTPAAGKTKPPAGEFGEVDPPVGEGQPGGPNPALMQERIWTDNLGRTVSARYEKMVGQAIVHLNVNGRSTPFPVDRLSAADQQFLRDNGVLAQAAAPGPNVPGGPVVPGMPAFPRPGVGGIPRPGVPNIPSFQPPERVPTRYPELVAGGGAIDGPRWWSTEKSLIYAKLRSIDWRAIELTHDGSSHYARITFADLANSERQYVLQFLDRLGQQALAKKIREMNPEGKFAGAPLTESERTMSLSRGWYDDFEQKHGNLVKITENGIEVDDGSRSPRTIFLTGMFEEDMKVVVDRLQMQQVPELLKVYAEQAAKLDMKKPHELSRLRGEPRTWTIAGQNVEGTAEWYGSQGMELRDSKGTLHRVAYKDLNEADAKYLTEYCTGYDELRLVKAAVASQRPNPSSIAGSPSPPSFSGPNIPSFPSPGVPSFPSAPSIPSFPAPSPPSFNPPSFNPGPPSFSPPPPPSVPSFDPQPVNTGFNQEEVGVCSNCNREVPAHIGAGGKCPHCGITFDYVENADGSRTYAPVNYIAMTIGVIVAFGVMLVRMGAFNQNHG